jgi:hypothetical protein
MRSWILPLVAVLCAALAAGVHMSDPMRSGPAENPMRWASDRWTTWEQIPSNEAALRVGVDGLPEGKWIRRFEDGVGGEVWHTEAAWETLPPGWSQRAWRGGWLSGMPEALNAWREDPGGMARKWKEGESGAVLVRTASGWAWEGEGWIVWSEDGAVADSEEPGLGELWAPEGAGLPEFWWAGSRTEEVPGWPKSGVEEVLRERGVRVPSRATRWKGGGRFHIAEEWRDEVKAEALGRGWTARWVDDDVVINGGEAWSWRPIQGTREGRDDRGVWRGEPLADGGVVWFQDGVEASRFSPREKGGGAGTAVLGHETDDRLLGVVRNHRTKGVMSVFEEGDGLVARAEDGSVVWGQKFVERALPGGVEEVDVYANGKFQSMVCFPSGLHLFDVNGRQVNGFPIRPPSGSWTAWALVDYDGSRKYRYLVASDADGLVQNYRKEGEATPGWRHRPASGIDLSSHVRHLHHLRLGSRDYLYVGRENGQVELLKRDGSPRDSTPVKVDARHAPVFRVGSNLDRTSVLFVDGTGWVREFSLGQGEEVGLSGATRADRIESLDVDGDGRDEVVTWLRGERTVWNARNEKVE